MSSHKALFIYLNASCVMQIFSAILPRNCINVLVSNSHSAIVRQRYSDLIRENVLIIFFKSYEIYQQNELVDLRNIVYQGLPNLRLTLRLTQIAPTFHLTLITLIRLTNFAFGDDNIHRTKKFFLSLFYCLMYF